MTFDPLVLGLVLVAALLHACWNTIVKTGRDGLLMFSIIKVPTMTVGLVVLALVGPPSFESVPYAIGSAIGFTGYCFLLIWAYRMGDLNLIYPVARGSAPLIVALLSGVLTGERLSRPGLTGIVIISVGIASFAYHPQAIARYAPDLLRAVGVGLCIASYTLLDGVGARVSQNVLGYTAMAAVFSGVPLIITTIALRGRELAGALREDWKHGLLGGVMMYTTYAIVIYAMTLTQVTYVAALRETSIIFAAIIGALLLKEPMGLRRMLAATIVAIGIIVMAFSGQ